MKSRPASRIRKTRSKTHPLPLSERERKREAPRCSSPLLSFSISLPGQVFLYFSPASLLSSASSSSPSEYLPLVSHSSSLVPAFSLSLSFFPPACTHLPAERGTCPTVALRLNELRWRRRKDRFVADHLDPRPSDTQHTVPRSVRDVRRYVRALSRPLSRRSVRGVSRVRVLESASSSAIVAVVAASRSRQRSRLRGARGGWVTP